MDVTPPKNLFLFNVIKGFITFYTYIHSNATYFREVNCHSLS